MAVYKQYNVYSKRILLLFLMAYLLNFLMEGQLAGLFLLIPKSLTSNYEFWRLITFPLAPGPIADTLLFSFVFYIIAPKLEEYLSNGSFLAYLVPLIFLQGIVYNLFFWQSSTPLTGMGGISIFVLTLFTYANPGKRVKLWFLPPLRTIYLFLLTLFVWAMLLVLNMYSTTDAVLMHGVFVSAFGIATGSLTYLKIYLLKLFMSRRDKDDEIDIPQPEELKLAMISEKKINTYQQEAAEEDYEFDKEHEEFNEEKLDQILDKIYEYGRESLTPNEVRFLKDYSEHMKK